jgi:hypothetical protein
MVIRRLSWILLDEGLQAIGRRAPLSGNLIEAPSRFLQAFQVQLPDRLAPPAGIPRV